MVIHSYLYYRLDESIISDDTWQKWANELVDLQKNHPECCTIGCFDVEFKDWTGATGMHLPATGDIRWKAEYLLRVYRGIVSTA